MRKWKNFKPGWHLATNTNRFHWFETQDKPLCEKKVKGFNLFIEPFETCFGTDKNASYYTGHCKNCLKKLKEDA